MPRTCKRRPSGGGAADTSLGWRDPQFSTGYTSCHDQHAPERAAAWLIRRFAVRPSLASLVAGTRRIGRAAMSARVIALPQPVLGTEVAIIGR